MSKKKKQFVAQGAYSITANYRTKIPVIFQRIVNLYGTAFKSRLRAHGTEFSPRRPFKCPVHM
jgi:hypothetical protein